jgi:hypothetical protein
MVGSPTQRDRNSVMARSEEIFEAHEERVAAITKIAVDLKALVINKTTDDWTSAENPDAEARVYAAAFQAWVDGKLHGSADEIFDAVQSALEV